MVDSAVLPMDKYLCIGETLSKTFRAKSLTESLGSDYMYAWLSARLSPRPFFFAGTMART